MNPAQDYTPPDVNGPLNHFFSLGLPGALPLQEEVVSRLVNMSKSIQDQHVRKDSVRNQSLHSLDIVVIIMGVMCLRIHRALLFHRHTTIAT